MPHVCRRTGLFRFSSLSVSLLLGMLLCIFASPDALPQANAHRLSIGFGAAYHGGGASVCPSRPYYGRPYVGYHRGYWPHYRHHPWFGLDVPVYPHRYYRHDIPNRSHGPTDAELLRKPPLRQSYQDIAPNLRSLFEPAPPVVQNAAPSLSTQTVSPPDAHEQHIVYPIRTRESREAWERAQRWYLGDVPRALKR